MPQRDIIVIGGSAGAFETVKTLIGGLPASFPASVFIVIHMMPEFPSLIEEHLSSHSRLPITQAADEEPIRRGHIYIARPDYHLAVESGQMRVLRGPRENPTVPRLILCFALQPACTVLASLGLFLAAIMTMVRWGCTASSSGAA